MRMLGSHADTQALIKEADGRLVVLDFFATWCGPCKTIAPKFEAMSQEFPNVVFAKVDVDQNEETTSTYKVNAMPTFVFIKNGSQVDSFSGANEAKLREMIAKHM